MLSSEDKILIGRYLQGKLDKKTLTDFLKRMNTDNAFFQEVLVEQIIQEGIVGADFKELEKNSKEEKLEDMAGFIKSLKAIEIDLEGQNLQSDENNKAN